MRRTLTVIFFVTGILSLYIITQANAESSSAGSVSDPLITKSYFDKNVQLVTSQEIGKQKVYTDNKIADEINKQKTYFDSKLAEELNKVKLDFDLKMKTEIAKVRAEQSLRIVTINNGQTLFANQGAEFIVRTGKTIVVSNNKNGISDITDGKDIPPGGNIMNNHLLIFPDQGRGIKPSSTNVGAVYVLVRGGYSIK